MFGTSRGMRLVWMVGVILLLGTAVGAGWALNQPAQGTGPAGAVEPPVQWIAGPGFVDVEEGTTRLHPVISGRVAYVLVAEGDEVKEGDMILSLDNTVQKLNVLSAEAELAAARQKLADAKHLQKDHDYELAMLELKIQGAGYKLDNAKSDRDTVKKLRDDKSYQMASEEQLQRAESAVKAAELEIEGLQKSKAKVKDADLNGPIELANENLAGKRAQRDLAQQAVFECDLYAPADGTILRLFAAKGAILSNQSPQFAVLFCPNAPRVVRMEILQEYAGKLKKGQIAFIEDDTRHGTQWKGKVERVSEVFTPRRRVIPEPFQFNDVLTLECIVSIESGNQPVRIGQRMRVIIK